MKRFMVISLIATFFLLPLIPSSSLAEPIRDLDIVVIQGSQLKGKIKVGDIRALAYKGGSFTPIPFQVDQKGADGDWIFTSGREAIEACKRPAQLGPRDEIVFIASDLGVRSPPDVVPCNDADGIEIEVKDPVTGKKGWTYLCFGEKARVIPRSGVRYINYDSDRDVVESRWYAAGFTDPSIPTAFNYGLIKPEGGGNGVDIVDRSKLRLTIRFMWGKIVFKRNEETASSHVKGWIEGPIRVIRRAAYSAILFWNIPSPAVDVDMIYCPKYMGLDVDIVLPFDVGWFITDATLKMGLDLNRKAIGMRFINSNNTSGNIIVDGLMSGSERMMDYSDYNWAVVTGPQGSILSRIILPPAFPIEKGLAYQDDALIPDPPEYEEGLVGYTGFDIKKLENIKRGKLEYEYYLYILSNGYKRGEEMAAMNVIDRPIEVKVMPLN